MTDKIYATADLTGYAEVFESLARLVESSPHPRLASVAIVNASICIALGVLGRKRVEKDLRQAIENLPMAEVQARGRLA